MFDGRLRFGLHPVSDGSNLLTVLSDVDIFVDLTTNRVRYRRFLPVTAKYVNYPIDKIPLETTKFSQLVHSLVTVLLNKSKRIYIHGKSGITRAELVATCIVGTYRKISPEKALEYIQRAYVNQGSRSRFDYREISYSKQQRFFCHQFLADVSIAK